MTELHAWLTLRYSDYDSEDTPPQALWVAFQEPPRRLSSARRVVTAFGRREQAKFGSERLGIMRKVLPAVLLFAATVFGASAQSSFYQSARSLQKVGYVLDDAFCRGSAIRCQQTPLHFWYNQPRQLGWSANDSIPAFKFVDASSIRHIQVYTLKSRHKIIGLAGLVMLQNWHFKDAASASRAALILKQNNLYYEEHLHKGPWTFYQAGPDLYLILTAGTYMRDELPKLTAALRQATAL